MVSPVAGKGEHLTSTQAAAYLGVARRTLRLWADDGRVPHYRTPGGHRRFLRSDLAALRAQRQVGRPLRDPDRQAMAWAQAIDEALASAVAALGPDEGAAFAKLRRQLRSECGTGPRSRPG